MYKMYPKFKCQLLVSKIIFCAKFVTAERASSIFVKTWLSTTWLNVQRSKIGIKWRCGECFKMGGSKFPNFRWNFANGIVVGLCIGYATLNYLGFDRKPNFILANTVVKAAEKNDSTAESCNRKMSIKEVVEKVERAVVKIEIQSLVDICNSEGSGFIVKSHGLIVTNTHVAQYVGQKVSVKLRDVCTWVQYRGVVEYVDSTSDLALVKINGSNLPVLKLADSKEAKVGETVLPIGLRPWYSSDDPVSVGIISDIQKPLPNEKLFNYILTDAPITEKHYGGPLVNLVGEVVGVNTTKKDQSGISFVIPSCYVKQVLENFKKKESK